MLPSCSYPREDDTAEAGDLGAVVEEMPPSVGEQIFILDENENKHRENMRELEATYWQNKIVAAKRQIELAETQLKYYKEKLRKLNL